MVTPETEKFPFVISKTRVDAVPSTNVAAAPAPVMTRLLGVVSPTVSCAVVEYVPAGTRIVSSL